LGATFSGKELVEAFAEDHPALADGHRLDLAEPDELIEARPAEAAVVDRLAHL
jgi:hypothetical protein